MNTSIFILLLTHKHLSAHLASRNSLDTLAEFAPDETGLATLQTLARQWNTASFHLLVDLADEEFHSEDIPHLRGADQRALLTRKLDQHYRTTPYRRIAVQQEKSRAQDTLLRSALTGCEVLDSVIDVLLAERCALAGIHSAALASAEVLHIESPHLLLVSHTAPGSWRQSYFTRGNLRFSRMGYPLAETHCTQLASQLAEDTRRTRQYLNTLHTLQRDETLEVVLLAHADETLLAEAFQQALHADAPHIHVSIESVAALAARLGFPANSNQWKTLLMQAIACGHIQDHYLPPTARRYHRMRQLGRGISCLAALIFLAGLLFGWHNHREAQQLQESIIQIQQALRLAETEQSAAEAKIRTGGASEPAVMKEAVSLYRRHLADWPDVEETTKALSQILAEFPLLVLDRFAWQIDPETPVPARQIIELAGHIEAFDGNYRASLEQLAQLQAQLGKLPRTTTTLQKAPLDTRPQGSIAPQENDMAHARFALRLVIAAPEKMK